MPLTWLPYTRFFLYVWVQITYFFLNSMCYSCIFSIIFYYLLSAIRFVGYKMLILPSDDNVT